MLDWVCSVTGARAARRVERIQSLWSGYGEIVRVRLEDGPAQTVIVKRVIPPALRSSSDRRSHDRKLRSYQVEAAFYRGFARESWARLPVCHAVEAREGGLAFVLEDLDAAGFGDRRHRVDDTELERCLAWLATFHATFMGRASEGLWDVGTYWHLDTRPDELDTMPEGPLKEAAAAIDRALSSASHRTLVHGDAKPANFCFGQTGVAAVDFQYVGGGCGMKDVVYLLSCLDDNRCSRDAPRHLDHYFAELRRALTLGTAAPVIDAIETEWRALVPLAWADFERFLLGWAPGHRTGAYAAAMCRAAIAGL